MKTIIRRSASLANVAGRRQRHSLRLQPTLTLHGSLQCSPNHTFTSTPDKESGTSSWIQDELKHAQEFVDKFDNKERVRRKSVQDVDRVKKVYQGKKVPLEPWGEELPGDRVAEEVEEEPEKDQADMTEEELAEQERREEAERLVNATPMAKVEGDKETVWDKRFESLKESVKSSAPMRALRRLRRQAETTDNPVVAPLRDIKEDMEDTIEDAREAYEVSQHPVVHKLRDLEDAAFGETETGWAVGELQEVDKGFDINLFLEDMEEYMIPVVIEAFLQPNLAILKEACDGQAARLMFQTIKEREVSGTTWDTRILNIDHVDFVKAIVVEDKPMVLLSFVCQHVHCIKNKKGEIVEGSESNINTVYYSWLLRRDFDNPDFDWKVQEMGLQRIELLV